MARRRDRPTVNPLLKDQVAAIVGPVERPSQSDRERTPPKGGAGDPAPPRSAGRGRSARKREQGVHIKARFTRSEADEVERFARTLSSYLGTTVMGSEVTRALWALAIRSQDELADLTGKAPRMDRPSYGDRMAMAQYEDAIADFLLLALKQTPRS